MPWISYSKLFLVVCITVIVNGILCNSPISAKTGEKISPHRLAIYFRRHNIVLYCACLLVAHGPAEIQACILPISQKTTATGFLETISHCNQCKFSSMFYLVDINHFSDRICEVCWDLYYELEHCMFRAFNDPEFSDQHFCEITSVHFYYGLLTRYIYRV